MGKGKRYNNVILIPTDFSAVCENAINHGVELAQFLHYKVNILHIVNNQPVNEKENEKPSIEQVSSNLEKYRQDYESRYSVKIDLLIREGNVIKVINKVAKEIKANIMVLGTHGKQGLQHLFGSHALKVVLDAPCPVVVVQKRSFGSGYKKIVLPVSSDIAPGQSLDWILLMSSLFNSKIYLFQSPETGKESNDRITSISQQIINILKKKDICYEVITAGDASDFSSQILSFAGERKCDLIMIMTMPGEEAAGFNFSAWNEGLMFNQAQIPVMCVNPIELGDYYSEWMS